MHMKEQAHTHPLSLADIQLVEHGCYTESRLVYDGMKYSPCQSYIYV